MTDATFLTRVVFKDYNSIVACDVRLGALTFLVGPNGSGKSNFLDVLRFVADALRTSLDYAVRERGGIDEIHRRSPFGGSTDVGLRLEFVLPSGATGHYAFQIGVRSLGGYWVQEEECIVGGEEAMDGTTWFRVRDGAVTTSVGVAPAATNDRLYLVNASGLAQFRPVYEAFSRMGFYNLNVDRIRDLQPPQAGDLLARDGSNIASILRRMTEHDFGTKLRIDQYLAAIVPGLRHVDARTIGPRETLEFRQRAPGVEGDWRFLAANMSDGTLRALGILVALFQARNGGTPRIPLVGIEEPEAALHPAAAEVLLDILREASRSTQVIVTSHSPDLLDNDEIDAESILAVVAEDGITNIGPIDDASRSVIRDHLYTAGDLLRMDQLRPASPATNGPSVGPAHLFDHEPG